MNCRFEVSFYQNHTEQDVVSRTHPLTPHEQQPYRELTAETTSLVGAVSRELLTRLLREGCFTNVASIGLQLAKKATPLTTNPTPLSCSLPVPSYQPSLLHSALQTQSAKYVLLSWLSSPKRSKPSGLFGAGDARLGKRRSMSVVQQAAATLGVQDQPLVLCYEAFS